METFYIRIKGHVTGPYDWEKLQSMAARGQLGKMHEVSSDGAMWLRASMYAELFPPPTRAEPAPGREPSAPTPARAPAPLSTFPRGDRAPARFRLRKSPALPAAKQWYWCRGAQRFGPVSGKELAGLAASGQLLGTDLIWTAGMDEWLPACRHGELFALAPAQDEPAPAELASGPERAADAGRLPGDLSASVNCPSCGCSQTQRIAATLDAFQLNVPLPVAPPTKPKEVDYTASIIVLAAAAICLVIVLVACMLAMAESSPTSGSDTFVLIAAVLFLPAAIALGVVGALKLVSVRAYAQRYGLLLEEYQEEQWRWNQSCFCPRCGRVFCPA